MKNNNYYLLLAFVAIMLCSVDAVAQPGTLDPSFADNGTFRFHPDFSGDNVQDMAIMSDGKMIVLSEVGYNSYLSRFQANGFLDSSFGNAGIQEVDLWDAENAAITVDDSDRTIIMALSSYFYYYDYDLFRYLSDGTLDSSFNAEGVAKTKISSFSNALITQPDGKIIVGGKITSHKGMQRFNDDGTEDQSFKNNINDALDVIGTGNIFGINLQQNGKIIVCGSTDDDLFIARFNADGTADGNFANGGIYIINSPNKKEGGLSIATLPDESLVVSGESETSDSSKIMCWKFQPDGLPDNTFGTNGNVVLHSAVMNDYGWFVLPDDDNSVVIGGAAYNGINVDPVLYHVLTDGTVDADFGASGTAGKTFTCVAAIKISGGKTPDGKLLYCGTKFNNGSYLTAVSQFLEDGTADSSFAVNGTNAIASSDAYSYNKTSAQTQLPDGKILVAGTSHLETYGYFPTLFRLNADGSIDSTYGTNGYLIPALAALADIVILAGDSTQQYIVETCSPIVYGIEDLVKQDNTIHFLVHKLDAEGNPDLSYGNNGIMRIEIPGYQWYDCRSAVIQQDGKLILAGTFFDPIDGRNVFVIRLNTNGTTDLSFANSGIQTFNWGNEDQLPRLALRSDGKLILQSSYYDLSGFHLDICRLLQDGTLDAAFGNNGALHIVLSNTYFILGMRLQNDNKILVLYNDQASYHFIRFTEDGTYDTTFGNNGTSSFSFYYFNSPDFMLQQDGKIILVGTTNPGLSIARFLANGSFDEDFGIDGVANFDTSSVGGGTSSHTLALQNDGKILVGSDDIIFFYIARVLNDIATGFEESKPAFTSKAFPNPVSDQLIIETSFSPDKDVTTIITNSLGQIIKQQSVTSIGNKITVNVNDLSSGIYLVTLKSPEATVSVKILKD